MKKLPASLALIAMFFIPSLDAQVRDWTRAADGKKIPAEFAGMKG